MQTGELPASLHDDAAEARPLSPQRAFAVLVVAIAITSALGTFGSRAADTPLAPTTIPDSDDFGLTDAEAKNRFRALNARLMRAYRQRDPSLVSTSFTADSPLHAKAFDDIQMLEQDNVLFRPHQKIERIFIGENTPTRITIRSVVRQRARFVTEAGEDVTTYRGVSILVVRWVLKKENGDWRLHDSEQIRVRRIDR